MTKLNRNILLFFTFFGLLTYIVAVEPDNVLHIKETIRRILNFPALLIITAVGTWGLRKHPQPWLVYVWLLVYVFEMLALGLYGAASFLYPHWATPNFRNFVSSLRHLLISPLPYAILLYLGKKR
ncbi:MAG: hypothetical protein EAY72_13860 [Bacteroidetes bacterium]|nr:MAG: hypothetical protein EAY72_13860 [Bacteroidota bacterium]